MEAGFVLLGFAVLAAFLLGPVGFFLTLGARRRVDEMRSALRSVEGRLVQTQLQLEQLLRQGPEAARGAGEASPAAPQPQPAPEQSAVAREPAEEQPSPSPLPEPPRRSPVPQTRIADADASMRSDEATSPMPPPELPPSSGSASVADIEAKRPSLEERLGTRWTVWIGGLALALGALLLVRYAIDQGLFGPGMRVIMGLLLGAVLIGAGERLRRKEAAEQMPATPVDAAPVDAAPGADEPAQSEARTTGALPFAIDFPPPSIPAVLTAAGTVAVFGSIYAAHALYGFIGPAIAFIALGMAGVATMFAAALHGPMLAGLGLAGSLVTPMLVSSNQPTPWPVLLYLLVVAAAAYGLARLRRWLWLALAAAIGAALWCLAFLSQTHGADGASFYHAALVHLIAQSALAIYILCYEPYRGIGPADGKLDPRLDPLPNWVSSGAAVLTLIALGGVAPAHFSALWMIAGVAIAAMLIGVAFTTVTAATAAIAGAVVCVGAIVLWPNSDLPGASIRIPGTPDAIPLTPPLDAGTFAAFALIVSLGAAAAMMWRVLRDAELPQLHTVIFATSAALTPLLALVTAWLRMTGGVQSMLFAALACGLAAAFTLTAHIFRNGVADHKPLSWDLALGISASAALAALALAMTCALDGGMLTVALALSALGAAFVGVRLDIPLLRWCVAALAVALAGRYLWEPRIHADIGRTPVFNWLLFGYGIPAASFGASAWLMKRTFGEDRPVQIAQAMAVLCSALLVYFEIRHFVFDGDPLALRSSLVEQGLMAIASFGFAIVLMRMDAGGASPVFRAASYLFGIASAVISIAGIGIAHNPMLALFGGRVEGGLVFNGLLLAFLLPGLMALLLGRMAQGVRPAWYVMGARIVAMALIFGYITAQTRRVFQGPQIGFGRYTTDGEWYAYSAVWLAFGIALLAYGLWRRSVEVRIASAGVIVLTVLKVFLFDLAGLEGFLQALSFIGLGGVLIGIGLVYQKWVFVRSPGSPLDTAKTE
ncbi:MAG: DUF2339 domain-containing protein [Beijerinckiaceae bacterium]